ncbi:MAG: hypothetical protein ACLU0O_03745 [Collinsella sp.]
MGTRASYITPTLRHARACVAAGADIVAIDATDRPRPDGKTVEEPSVRCTRRACSDGGLCHHRGHSPCG